MEVCTKCNKQFNRKDNLMRHTKTVNCQASPLTTTESSDINSNTWLKRVRSHKRFIKKFKFASDVRRRAYLTNSSKDEINILCECLRKVCNGKIRPEQSEKKKLKRYSKAIHLLIERGTSDRKKKKLLIRNRDFLPTLVNVITSYMNKETKCF